MTKVPSIQRPQARVKGGIRALGLPFVLAAAGLSACSSVPDAVNPAAWYSAVFGDSVAQPKTSNGDFPNPTVQTSKPQLQVADGLVADTQNSNYAPAPARDSTPTKPLVRKPPTAPVPVQPDPVPEAALRTAPKAATPVATVTSPAAAPTAPTAVPATRAPAAAAPTEVARTPAPAPAVAAAPVAVPTAPAPVRVTQPVARAELAPSAPPPVAPVMTPPSRPDIPDQVPVPVAIDRTSPARVAAADHYQQRLQESAAQSVATTARGTVVSAAPLSPQTVHLVPPKLVGADQPPAASGTESSSFLLAALDFKSGGVQLTPSDIESLREVAQVYRRTGGSIRVLGLGSGGGASGRSIVISGGQSRSAPPASPIGRAEAVSAELVRLGVPEAHILVGAVAPGTPAAADGAAARVYLDM